MNMQTITTKYLGPTNTKGARIKAVASGAQQSITISYDHESNDHGHIKAANALAAKLGWTGRMIGGDTKEGKVFVFADEDGFEIHLSGARRLS